MSTLFILSHAPHTNPGQARTVDLARSGDGIVLIEDGVYAAAPIEHPLSTALQAAVQRGAGLYALKPDLDVIVCRNVLIYFDNDDKKNIVTKFHKLLRPGGHLFVGHSESLMMAKSLYQYVGTTVYQKI